MSTQTQSQTLMRISVVIAVYNGGADLEKCLTALDASTYPVLECILVDDASTDAMVSPVAERHGSRVIRLDQQSGPAKARNLGVREAQGDIIFFTDADVLLHPDAIAQAVSAFEADPELAAVMGSYDDQPGHQSFISQYRNLFHHWVHQNGADEASTFWTGCGAIRRDIFLEMGGFSENFQRPSIEDIELGSRLRKAGQRIRLQKSMLGKHLKDWRFWNMVRTDILQRAVPWMLLVLGDGTLSNDLNLNYKSRLATLLAGLFGLSLLVLLVSGHVMAIVPSAVLVLAAALCARVSVAAVSFKAVFAVATILAVLAPVLIYWLWPDPFALIPVGLILAIAVTQLSFYRYARQKRNSAFAIGVLPVQLVFFLGCASSIPLALIQHTAKRRSNTD